MLRKPYWEVKSEFVDACKNLPGNKITDGIIIFALRETLDEKKEYHAETFKLYYDSLAWEIYVTTGFDGGDPPAERVNFYVETINAYIFSF